jgi:hypothetical protein
VSHFAILSARIQAEENGMISKLLLTAVVCVGAIQAQDADQQVRANEPTVLTIRAKSEQVALQPELRPQRKANRFKLGGIRALTGVGHLTGWMLSSGDDIPASRENAPSRLTDTAKSSARN